MACSFIVANSMQLLFPLINTADSINVPWFRLTLMDLAFILLFHRFQTLFDRIKTAICRLELTNKCNQSIAVLKAKAIQSTAR